jgi:radical SAM superfamily enzyme YgiQ (UPF0313 family)
LPQIIPLRSNPSPLNAASEERALAPLGHDLNVLLVWPRFVSSFWSMSGMLELLPQECLHPPLGLITVAALCPPHWTLRLIDRSCQLLTDADIEWADLVMVSGMRVQEDDMRAVLDRARALGTRTIVGGPFASSQSDLFLAVADHVVVGEPDQIFDQIARDLEAGTARRLYLVDDKPDVTHTPVPRFDLLDLGKYLSMTVQFSRGCPFQCEFCDIITIYGRKPRTKSPDQMLRELDSLYALGWRNRVFVVDDNFIGNHRRALELAGQMAEWQRERDYPMSFTTEASMDLAQHPDLIAAMVKANFWSVFVGIESPSRESLVETKKFQNLRQDPLESVKRIQREGLWVTGGFIVGFDSDAEDIFERQVEFVEQAAIVWAMTGFLEALPTTPLYERLAREGRLIDDGRSHGNFKPPNFRTVLPLRSLLSGGRHTLQSIYAPDAFFARALRSLDDWRVEDTQRAPATSRDSLRGVLLKSIVKQGLLSSYRRQYWAFLYQLLRRWRSSPQKLWLGLSILVSAHHFIRYAQQVASELEGECQLLAASESPAAVAVSAGAA